MQSNVLFTMFKKGMYFRLNATESSVSICEQNCTFSFVLAIIDNYR